MNSDNKNAERVLNEARDSLNQLSQAMARTHNSISQLNDLLQQAEALPAPAQKSAPRTEPAAIPSAPAPPPPRVIGRGVQRLSDYDRVAALHPQERSRFWERQSSKSEKKRLTSEQIIIRAIAVLGSIITVIGVGLGITLAIQSGLLGPFGRVVLAVLLAIVLFAAGIIVEKKSEATAGSTALYVTSLLTAAVTFYALMVWLEWWPVPLAVVAHFLLFAFFAFFALQRQNSALLISMAVAGFLYLPAFIHMDVLLTGITCFLPTVLLLATLAKGEITAGMANARIAASVVAIELAIFPSAFLSWEHRFSLWLPVIALVLFALTSVAMETRSPYRSTALVQLTVVPLALLFIGSYISFEWNTWLIPLGVGMGYALLQRADTAKPALTHLAEQSTAWLCFGAYSLVVLYWKFPIVFAERETRRFLVLAVFLAAFFAVMWHLRAKQPHRHWVILAWAAAALLMTYRVSASVIGIYPADLISGAIQLQATCLALVLVVAFLNREVLVGLPREVLGIIGVIALFLYMDVMVTFTTALFALGGLELAAIGFVVGHAMVSVSWIVLAAWVLLGERFMANKHSLTIGLVLAIAASLKLVFFDLASTTGITRAIAFTVSGILLITIATLRVRQGPRDHGVRDAEEAVTYGAEEPADES